MKIWCLKDFGIEVMQDDDGKFIIPDQFKGTGSALKPAHEPIVLARKPLDGCTIAENVLRWGVGGLNIDACRISTSDNDPGKKNWHQNRDKFQDYSRESKGIYGDFGDHATIENNMGRFPANFIHDGSPEVLTEFAKAGDRKVGFFNGHRNKPKTKNDFGIFKLQDEAPSREASAGSAARFFQSCPFTEEDYAPFIYVAKASRAERERGLDGMPDTEPIGKDFNGGNFNDLRMDHPQNRNPVKNNHPTVKPLSLMRYLCRLITPPGGLILDPFGGSGTTGLAAIQEGFHYILIEQEKEYVDICNARIVNESKGKSASLFDF